MTETENRVFVLRALASPGWTCSKLPKKYNVHQLVYYEVHGDSEAALTREKQIKKWDRKWKIELIEEQNPDWRDLYEDIL